MIGTSAYLPAGIDPDDGDEEAILVECGQCGNLFRKGQGVKAFDSDVALCSRFCRNRREESQAVLIKTQPVGVVVDGWQV